MKARSWWVGVASASLLLQVVQAEAYRTPRAGDTYQTEIWSKRVKAPARDRRHVTALNLGLQYIPDGPSMPDILPFGGALVVRDTDDQGEDVLQPFGAIFVWRNPEDGQQRLRGIFSGLYNDVRYNISPRFLGGMEAVLTFENFNVPFARPEYVEGQRIEAVDLEWQYVRGGLGLGYRTRLAPGHQDNALELTLTYEPGFIWFDPDVTIRQAASSCPETPTRDRPTRTGRCHERNLMELGHRGYTAGADLLYGHRANLQDWGEAVLGIADGEAEQDYFAASLYAVATGGVPLLDSERHRLTASLHAGIGKDLDRFSAFRLLTRPTAYEWEAVSRPDLPGAIFDEFSRSYGIIELRYRYEALFFLSDVRANWAWVDRPRFQGDGRVPPIRWIPCLP